MKHNCLSGLPDVDFSVYISLHIYITRARIMDTIAVLVDNTVINIKCQLTDQATWQT